MAKRLHGDVYGINGTKYTIEIHDQVQSATSLECNFSADGIDYKGNGNPLYLNTIMSSSCEVNIKIDSQGKLNIIWDIISKGENWYYIVIKKSDSIYWIGTLIADQITIPRGSYQGVIQTSLKANDRLSILENLPFDFGTFSLDGARERGLEIIKQILQFDVSHFLDEWGASDRYLLDSIESKEANQADGVLLNTSYKKQSFIKDYNTRLYVTGEVEYISCAEAIKQILMPHKAQILLSNGTYIIRQVENNFSASTEFNAYTKTLSALTTYTISNGINVQDNARSCFAAQPDYTFQPAIREISSEITKQNSVDAIKTTFDDSNMVLNFPNGLKTNKNVRLSFKTGELVSSYQVGGVTNYAFETHFAALIYGTYAGEYYYYQNSVWNNNGTTIPDSTKSFIFFTVTRYNNAPEESVGNLEFLSHSAFLSDVVINIWARDHIYAPRVSYPSFDPKFRQAYWSFSQIVTADFTGSLSLQVSYNNADDDEEAEFEESKKYANDINASNANFTNDVEYKNVYHSGDEDDIFGLMTYNGSTWVENPSIQQVGFTETHKFELLPLIMAANIYENTLYTLEGSLLTNGSIHAINSIEIDGDTWVFNGGRLLFMNESIDGQWVKIYKNNINSGNGGYLAHSGQDGILSDLRGLNIKIEKVGGQMGDLLGQLMVRVFEEQGDTANPTEDSTKALKLAYTHSTGGYQYKFEEEAAGVPFNVTSDTSSVAFGATVNITLTGSYFKEDSVVSISKGTLNSTTINSSEEMVLNITAIASAEAVNTCDVTIDGVTFTALWTYEIVWTAELVPGDGTTVWNTTGTMTTGEGFISFPNNGSNWAQGGWFEELPDAATTFELLLDPLREGTTGTNHYGTAGLGAPVTSIPGYPTVDHGFYFASVTAIPLVNGGTSAGSLSWANGDTFKLSGTNTSGDSWDLVWTKISGGVSTQMKTQTVTISAELDFQCALLRHRKLQNIVLKYLTP